MGSEVGDRLKIAGCARSKEQRKPDGETRKAAEIMKIALLRVEIDGFLCQELQGATCTMQSEEKATPSYAGCDVDAR